MGRGREKGDNEENGGSKLKKKRRGKRRGRRRGGEEPKERV